MGAEATTARRSLLLTVAREATGGSCTASAASHGRLAFVLGGGPNGTAVFCVATAA